MKFEFETSIKESKGAVNTAAKIAEILKNSKVIFSTGKETKVPGIWVKFQGEEKQKWVASKKYSGNEDYYNTSRQYS